MSAQLKLDGRARLALVHAIEELEKLPVCNRKGENEQVETAIDICAFFVAHFVDFDPSLFLSALELKSYVPIPKK